MPATDLYPPAPAGVPANFTRPSAAYRRRTAAVLAGLFGFLVLYLALIAAACYAAFWLLQHPPTMPRGRGAFIVGVAYVGAIACALMLLLFLVKGLFKSQRADRHTYVRVTREQQPELFAFIDRVCAETAAPKPATSSRTAAGSRRNSPGRSARPRSSSTSRTWPSASPAAMSRPV